MLDDAYLYNEKKETHTREEDGQAWARCVEEQLLS
jgi:hypothetical protein